MQPLSITRFSIVNSLGAGREAIVSALREERSGLSPCKFETVDLNTYIGQVEGLESAPVRSDLAAYDCRNNRLAQIGLHLDEFEDSARDLAEKVGPARIGVFVGTSTSGILQTELAYRRRNTQSGALPADFLYAQTQNCFSVADFVQRYLHLRGPAFVVSSACSSSAKVFAHAARMIAAGVCDAAVVGGVDSLCLTTLYGFNALELVSAHPCRPYDVERDGISIGEGAGFALLEKVSDARACEALLLGVGESCDAYHMSTPHPEGAGARLAMQRALESAQLSAGDIDYINLHGTATRTNDLSEDKATYSLFGNETPCSSTKGATGHLLGAAGVTEAIVSILAMQNDLMPASVHTQEVDPELKSRYLTRSRPGRVERVLSNSFGFGGSNCSVVLGSS